MEQTLQLLIVEDDPVMQLGLRQFFEDYPQVQIAQLVNDGYAAIAAAQSLQPDVILMDVGLPKLDGIATTQHIKAVLPDMRVVMLTSHRSETEIIAALSSGADAYCVKATRLDPVIAAIAAVQEGAIYLDPQIARQVMQHLKPPATAQAVHLSERELEVLKLLVEGKTNPEIAQALYLSVSTVKVHLRNIMGKLAVDDRVQAAVAALRSGLV